MSRTIEEPNLDVMSEMDPDTILGNSRYPSVISPRDEGLSGFGTSGPVSESRLSVMDSKTREFLIHPLVPENLRTSFVRSWLMFRTQSQSLHNLSSHANLLDPHADTCTNVAHSWSGSGNPSAISMGRVSLLSTGVPSSNDMPSIQERKLRRHKLLA